MNNSDTTISETDTKAGSGKIPNGNNQIVTVRKGIRDIVIDCDEVRQRIEAGEQAANIAAELGIRAKQLRHVLERTGGKPREQPSEEQQQVMNLAAERRKAAEDRAAQRVAGLIAAASSVVGTNGRTYETPAMAAMDALGIDAVCDLTVSGATTAQIAKQVGISVGSVYNWLEQRGHGDRFARARRESADVMALETWRIAMDERIDVYRAKLQVDVLRWLAGKWDRARYGEKLDVQNTVTVQRLTDEQLAEKAIQIQQRLGLSDGAT